MKTPLIITYPATSFRRERRRQQNDADVPPGRIPRLARSLQVPATGGGGWSRWTNMHVSAGLIATA